MASQRLEDAAARIARAGASATPVAEETPESTSSTSSAPAGTGPSALAAQESSSFIDDLVSVKEAEILYKASAKVLGAIQRTQAELFDIEI